MAFITFYDHKLRSLCEAAIPNIETSIQRKMNEVDSEVKVSTYEDIKSLTLVKSLLAETSDKTLVTITHDDWRILLAYQPKEIEVA